ncbi:hypothetical protein F4782DRAFT_491714 [Xylaria castorea]|nr:hypothetical protein F4782DRAFT_491714 [Xylaria castorea]
MLWFSVWLVDRLVPLSLPDRAHAFRHRSIESLGQPRQSCIMHSGPIARVSLSQVPIDTGSPLLSLESGHLGRA